MRALVLGLLLMIPAPVYASDGRIVFDVQPQRARVRVDGVEVGRAGDYDGTWDRLAVAAGVRVIELGAPGFRTLRIELEVVPGGRYRISERLVKGRDHDPREPRAGAPPTGRNGRLRLYVSPADAAVYLNGEFLARADELVRLHGALPLAAGVHHLEAVCPGYTTRNLDIAVAVGRPAEVRITLERSVP